MRRLKTSNSERSLVTCGAKSPMGCGRTEKSCPVERKWTAGIHIAGICFALIWTCRGAVVFQRPWVSPSLPAVIELHSHRHAPSEGRIKVAETATTSSSVASTSSSTYSSTEDNTQVSNLGVKRPRDVSEAESDAENDEDYLPKPQKRAKKNGKGF
ncbi:hypothetical protein FS842_010336 [Serendipita sp. 407]|nr:hypothetical protein FS842_010336 [Serendipita sp. 407]